MKFDTLEDGRRVLYVHQSDLTNFDQCPEQLRLKMKGSYLDYDGDAAFIGTCAHAFVEHALTHRKDEGEWPNPQHSLNVAVAMFEAGWESVWRRPHQIKTKDEALQMLARCCQTWWDTHLPTIPVDRTDQWLIEGQFDIDLGWDFDNEIELHLRGSVDFFNGYYMEDWKGLPLDCPLPSTHESGWTTMGEVQVGDVLFDSAGRQTTVTAKSEVHYNPCFEVTFDDGSTVIADHEHRWPLLDGGVVTTTDLHPDCRITVAGALDRPEAQLPVDPWLFGYWLGKGRKRSGEMTIGSWAGRGMLVGDRQPDVKHIPTEYLNASPDQRWALLQGLMDSDGQANPARKQSIYSTTSDALARDVAILLSSLGVKFTRWHGPSNETRLTFSSARCPFTFQRKVEAHTVGDPRYTKFHYRKVVSIERVEQVPTQCITVDSPDSTYLCTERMLVTHNTGSNREAWKLERYGRQATVYSWGLSQLLGRPINDFRYVFVGRDGDYKVVEAPRTAAQRRVMIEHVLALGRWVVRDIDSPWPRGDKDWWCSSRWCSHHARDLCVGAVNKIHADDAHHLTQLVELGVKPSDHMADHEAAALKI